MAAGPFERPGSGVSPLTMSGPEGGYKPRLILSLSKDGIVVRPSHHEPIALDSLSLDNRGGAGVWAGAIAFKDHEVSPLVEWACRAAEVYKLLQFVAVTFQVRVGGHCRAIMLQKGWVDMGRWEKEHPCPGGRAGVCKSAIIRTGRLAASRH